MKSLVLNNIDHHRGYDPVIDENAFENIRALSDEGTSVMEVCLQDVDGDAVRLMSRGPKGRLAEELESASGEVGERIMEAIEDRKERIAKQIFSKIEEAIKERIRPENLQAVLDERRTRTGKTFVNRSDFRSTVLWGIKTTISKEELAEMGLGIDMTTYEQVASKHKQDLSKRYRFMIDIARQVFDMMREGNVIGNLVTTINRFFRGTVVLDMGEGYRCNIEVKYNFDDSGLHMSMGPELNRGHSCKVSFNGRQFHGENL